jgi:MFS family permease
MPRYGTLFYSISLLSAKIQQTFQWPSAFIFGVFSLGLLCGGLLAPLLGRRMDRFGARYLMVAGSFFIGLGLFALAHAQGKVTFFLAVIFIESISALVLYESAFVALAQFAGRRAGVLITQITLIAGFASSLFWPLIAWLLTWLDWRQTYMVLAALHLCICLPIHWRVLRFLPLPEKVTMHIKCDTTNFTHVIAPHARTKWLLALAFGVGAYAITALQIHLFGLLAGLGISQYQAVAVGVLIGPAQVAARVADLALSPYVTPIITGLFSIVMMGTGIFCLLYVPTLPWLLTVFAILFGVGQGLTSIVRGTIPLYLFGAKGYGGLSGQLNGVRMALTAAAPLSFALIIEYSGSLVAVSVLVALMLISLIALKSLPKLVHR